MLTSTQDNEDQGWPTFTVRPEKRCKEGKESGATALVWANGACVTKPTWPGSLGPSGNLGKLCRHAGSGRKQPGFAGRNRRNRPIDSRGQNGTIIGFRTTILVGRGWRRAGGLVTQAVRAEQPKPNRPTPFDLESIRKSHADDQPTDPQVAKCSAPEHQSAGSGPMPSETGRLFAGQDDDPQEAELGLA